MFVCQSNGGASDPSAKSENIDVETVIAHNINFQKTIKLTPCMQITSSDHVSETLLRL